MVVRYLIASALVVASQVIGSDADAQRWPFHYPEPPTTAVRVTTGVQFATVDTLPLAMDVYRPATSSGPAPALILYQLFWLGEGTPRESNDHTKSWARIAAANGIVAIIPDLRAEPGTGNAARPSQALGDDFARLVAHLTENATRYGIDPERLAVFSASGAVWPALSAVQHPGQTAIKAAVMYYGGGDVTTFRVDLPLLYVRAGLDSPTLNASIVRLVSTALGQNAPVRLVNHHTGHHAFEARNDDATTRQVIDETISFVKTATAPTFQAAIRNGHLDALAAGQMSVGNYRDAATTLAEVVTRRPTDGAARFAYGQALIADKQYEPACAEFSRMTSFAAILPGARSCLLSRGPDSTIAFLRGMRRDWLQSQYLRTLQTDSVFAPLWARADYQALFRKADSVGTTR